jgi:hypothetical protein
MDSKESIPPAYVAWLAITTTLYSYTRFLALIDCLKIQAQTLTIKMFVENGGMMTAWNSAVMRQFSEVPAARVPRLATWIEHVSLKGQLIEIFRS